MKEEFEDKNEKIEEENNSYDLLNGTGRKRRNTDKLKAFFKGALKNIVKKGIIKSLITALIIVAVTVVVVQPLFTIIDTVKNLTLVNMGQALPNADSSTYSTTTGVFGRIAGSVVTGFQSLGRTILNFFRH